MDSGGTLGSRVFELSLLSLRTLLLLLHLLLLLLHSCLSKISKNLNYLGGPVASGFLNNFIRIRLIEIHNNLRSGTEGHGSLRLIT